MDLSAKENFQEVNEEGEALVGLGTYRGEYRFLKDSGNKFSLDSGEVTNLDNAIGFLLPSNARFSPEAKWLASGFDTDSENILWQKFAWSVHYGQAVKGERQEVRLVRKKGEEYEALPDTHPDIVRSFLAVQKSRLIGRPETSGPQVNIESVSVKTLRIRSGEAKSVADGQEPRDGTQVVEESHEEPENLVLDARVIDGKEVWVDLLPVEIEVPKTDSEGNIVPDEYVSASELKVGKMEGAISNTDPPSLNIDDDVDHFRIRIPGGSSMGSVSLKVGSTENPLSKYNDDPTEIELHVDGDDLVTPTMLMVSDIGDDTYSANGVGIDDQKNDRTHLVQLGGKLHITEINIDGKKHSMDQKVEVPAERELDLKIIFLGPASNQQQAFKKFLEIASERYAQVGIRLKITEDTGTLPDSVDPMNVKHDEAGKIMIGTDPSWLVNPEIKQIVDHVKNEQSQNEKEMGAITAFVVPNMTGSARGRAYTMRGTAAADQAYANYVFLSAADIILGNFGYTVAHEVGHVLTNNFHYGNGSTIGDYGNPQWWNEIQANLMKSGTSSLTGLTNHMSATKRLYKIQEDMLVDDFLTEVE